ncbi:MAG: hypothetical protein AAF226_11415 [Verrucomicrobiota bacterium]
MSFTLEKAVQLMDQAHACERLAHAYLIIGPRGSGKEHLAIRMIEMVSLGGVAGVASLNHLRNEHTVIVEPESKSRRIKVEAIRAAEHVLQMAAPAGVTKHAIIRDADCMGQEAENAFLKTLEEPPRASRLILMTARPELLLDTILSRCIRIHLTGNTGPIDVPVNLQPFFQSLSQHAASGKPSVSSALGLMAQFNALLKSEKAAAASENDAAYKVEVEQYKNTTDGSFLKQREDYYKAQTEADYLDRRNQLIEYLVLWYGDALRMKSGSNKLDLPAYSQSTGQLANQQTVRELTQRIAAVEDLQQQLNTNAQEALALEVGFIRAFG